ncbi:hypothetical protein B425_3444 [Bacillus amyloliquefaciens]|nr:hypothetical protein B425_3444 [Bacillus amyloliquefaciens]
MFPQPFRNCCWAAYRYYHMTPAPAECRKPADLKGKNGAGR